MSACLIIVHNSIKNSVYGAQGGAVAAQDKRADNVLQHNV